MSIVWGKERNVEFVPIKLIQKTFLCACVCMCVHVCSFPNEQCEKSPEPLMSHHFGPCSGVISLDTLDWCFPSSIHLNLHAQSRLHSPHLPLPPQWLKWRWRAEVSYFRQMSLLHGGGRGGETPLAGCASQCQSQSQPVAVSSIASDAILISALISLSLSISRAARPKVKIASSADDMSSRAPARMWANVCSRDVNGQQSSMSRPRVL